MVLQGEGKGKISSIHSAKYFGDQMPPNMGSHEMD